MTLTITNYMQTYGTFDWGDRDNYSYRFLYAFPNSPDNLLYASSSVTPVNDGAGFTRHSQEDVFTTTWIEDATDLGELLTVTVTCGLLDHLNTSGQTLKLYVHLNPPPPTYGDHGLPDGTLIHTFTAPSEQFAYDLEQGTTAVAFTLVASPTKDNWPSTPGTDINGDTQTGVYGNVSFVLTVNEVPVVPVSTTKLKMWFPED
jgi:hypothetical protein